MSISSSGAGGGGAGPTAAFVNGWKLRCRSCSGWDFLRAVSCQSPPHKISAVTQRVSPCSTLTSSTASPPANSPCSTLPPVSASTSGKDCSYGAVTSPTSTLESRDSGIIATLTSYSENVERSKYGGEGSKDLGSRGNLKPWQSQKSSMDSCLYRVDENMTASTYSLNKIPERNLDSVLSQSVQSIPLYLMPRPNSVAATSSAHLEDLAYLDEQRHTPLRTSLRMPRQTLGGVRTQPDLRVSTADSRSSEEVVSKHEVPDPGITDTKKIPASSVDSA